MNTTTTDDIEAIKQLKARYCRLLDRKRWGEWADVFTHDVHMHYGPAVGASVDGAVQVVALATNRFAHATTVHCAYMPEIDITSATTATGIWAMFDYVEFWQHEPQPNRAPDPDVFLGYRKGYGHYEESYDKGADGRWRISALQLIRLRVDRHPGARLRDDYVTPTA